MLSVFVYPCYSGDQVGPWEVWARHTKTQRDPQYFGDDADDFRPGRWLNAKHYWDFVPFGGGPRRCPAQMMVMTESAYMLARLAQVYRKIEPRDANKYTAVMRVGPSNKTGVLLAFSK